jgi:PAS domain S-box-containing protein
MTQGNFDSLFFRLMTEQAPTICWATDRQLRFTAGMGAGLAAIGITDAEADIGRTLYDFLGTNDETHPAIAAANAALRGESSDYEDTWAGRHFESHVEPLRDDEGEIIGCVGLAVDVTPRKEAELKLRRNESRMREAFVLGAAAKALLLVDDLRIEEVNDRFVELTGSTRAELQGQPLAELNFLQPSVLVNLARLDSTLEGFRDMESSISIGGVTKHVLVSGVRFRAADGDRVQLSLVDITRQILSTRESQQAQGKQEQILASAPAMVYRLEGQLDPFEFRVAYASPEVKELLGLTAEECYEDPDKFVSSIHPDDRSGYAAAVVKANQSDDLVHFEFRLASNPNRWIHFQSRREGSPDGWHAYTGVAMDITRIKQRENSVRESFEEISKWYYSGQKQKQQQANQLKADAQRISELDERIAAECSFQKEVFEQLPLICVEFDFNGHVKQHCGGGLKWLGSDPAAIGAEISKMLPPDSQEVRSLLRGETQRLVSPTANPASHPLEILLLPAKKGRPFPRAVLLDNSSQEQIERLLVRSEEKWRSLAESAVDYVVVINPAGEIEYVNHPEGENKGLRIGGSLLDVFSEKYRGLVSEQLQDVLATGRVRQTDVEIEQETETKFYTARITPMFDGGRVIAATFFATDITERKRAEDALRDEQRLLRKLLSIQERERQVVAYEVHDGVVQGIVGAHLKLQRVFEILGNTDDEMSQRLQEMNGYLADAIEDGRRLISGLRPIILDERGLAEALRLYIDELNAVMDGEIRLVTFLGTERFPEELENTLFRIAQEALQNVRRHAHATITIVSLKADDDGLTLSVDDDGCGFEIDKVPKDHFGIEGMVHRARLFGGTAKIQSKIGQGTNVTVTLPLELPTL